MQKEMNHPGQIVNVQTDGIIVHNNNQTEMTM